MQGRDLQAHLQKLCATTEYLEIIQNAFST